MPTKYFHVEKNENILFFYANYLTYSHKLSIELKNENKILMAGLIQKSLMFLFHD
jgi:hypothetical protein